MPSTTTNKKIEKIEKKFDVIDEDYQKFFNEYK